MDFRSAGCTPACMKVGTRCVAAFLCVFLRLVLQQVGVLRRVVQGRVFRLDLIAQLSTGLQGLGCRACQTLLFASCLCLGCFEGRGSHLQVCLGLWISPPVQKRRKRCNCVCLVLKLLLTICSGAAVAGGRLDFRSLVVKF